MTSEEFSKLGKACRDYANPLIGAFAAELIGDSYPFTASMTEVMLKSYSDEDLGRKFATWMDNKEEK